MQQGQVHFIFYDTPREYVPVWNAMRDFTRKRTEDTPDQVWLLEHYPVYSLGQAGKPEHILTDTAIPIVQSDRGGQVTYHGPGQLVVYMLVNLRRLGWYVKEYVAALEEVLLQTLAELGVDGAKRITGAPGIYIPESTSLATGVVSQHAKIAALGLKVHQGCSYHGLALNIAMDLTPFTYINPCGFANLPTRDLQSLGVLERYTKEQIQDFIVEKIQQVFFLPHLFTPIFHREP